MQEFSTEPTTLIAVVLVLLLATRILRQPLIHTPENEQTIFILGYKADLLNGGIEDLVPADRHYVVIDKDPSVIDLLRHKNISHRSGDVSDTDFLDRLGLENNDLILSNIKNKEVNKQLIVHVRKARFSGQIIINADRGEDVAELYQAGADLVEVPKDVAVQEAAALIKQLGTDKSNYEQIRKDHIKKLSK